MKALMISLENEMHFQEIPDRHRDNVFSEAVVDGRDNFGFPLYRRRSWKWTSQYRRKDNILFDIFEEI